MTARIVFTNLGTTIDDDDIGKVYSARRICQTASGKLTFGHGCTVAWPWSHVDWANERDFFPCFRWGPTKTMAMATVTTTEKIWTNFTDPERNQMSFGLLLWWETGGEIGRNQGREQNLKQRTQIPPNWISRLFDGQMACHWGGGGGACLVFSSIANGDTAPTVSFINNLCILIFDRISTEPVRYDGRFITAIIIGTKRGVSEWWERTNE